MDTAVTAPVSGLLRLLSAEGLLVCRACGLLLDGCGCAVFEPGAEVPVADLLRFKDGPRLESIRHALRTGAVLPPVQVEDGRLIDGHHRVAAALAEGVLVLTVAPQVGVLAVQREYHRRLIAARIPAPRPAPDDLA